MRQQISKTEQIMERAQVVNGTIRLPKSATQWIGRVNELAVSVQGDALILTKIRTRRLSGFADRASDDKPMPIKEIVAEVRQVRKASKRARRS
jgi:hypothetical protein